MLNQVLEDYKYCTASQLAEELGGSEGRNVCCPGHDDSTPSLSIAEGDDGKVLLYCHAGCTYQAIRDALQQRGLVPTDNPQPEAEAQDPKELPHQKRRLAISTYLKGKPGTGTVVEDYLRSRNINLPVPAHARLLPAGTLNQNVLFKNLPAMMFPLSYSDGQGVAGVHVTFLHESPLKRHDRMMCGPVKGGVVRLGDQAGAKLCIAEGIETAMSVAQLTGLATWAACSAWNLDALAIPADYREIIVCADHDDAGLQGARKLAQRAAREGKLVRLAVPEKEGDDWNDVLRRTTDPTTTRDIILNADFVDPPLRRAIPVSEFIAMDIPPRKVLLEPWLPEQGLAMIHAERGIGKTFLALGVSFALALGQDFLGWQVPTARGVLYLDGEMPASELQKRTKSFCAFFGTKGLSNLLLLGHENLRPGERMPDITTEEGQALLEEEVALLEQDVGDASLIVIDNISTLCRTGVENEAEGWQAMQDWAIRQRQDGRSVLFVHHSGKAGRQRGTSKREDILDTVINLRRPAEVTAEDGAEFEIVYEKARGFFGGDAQTFRVRMESDSQGKMNWRRLADNKIAYVAAALNSGETVSQIAKALGCSRPTVYKYKEMAKEEGLLEQA